MRIPTLLLLTAALFTGRLIAGGPEDKGSNASVQFTVSAARTGHTLLFTLRPKKGLHINLEPGMMITADSAGGVFLAGQPQIPTDTSTHYLDQSAPIRQQFRLSKPAAGDSVTVTGSMTYYYCSDTEGWCSRFKQPFSLKVRSAP